MWSTLFAFTFLFAVALSFAAFVLISDRPYSQKFTK